MSPRLVRLASIAVLAGSVSLPLLAQSKAKSEGNVHGTVVDVGHEKSTITVKYGGGIRLVSYNANTKFFYGHSTAAKPGSFSQVKETFYISCNLADAKTWTASECVYRESK
jgi:hypothetical protein